MSEDNDATMTDAAGGTDTNNNDQPLYISNPEKWLEETVNEDDDCLVCIVLFRGSWCKYDHYYLKKLGVFINKKRQELNQKVKLIAWTSQGPEGAALADKEWGLTTPDCAFDMVLGDDNNALATYLIDDVILPNLHVVSAADAKIADIIPPGSHPNGVVLAGQVWWAHHGTPVFEWASKFDPPSGEIGGPHRPEPNFVWEQVMKRKHALDIGNAIMPVHGDSIKICATETEVSLAANCSVMT